MVILVKNASASLDFRNCVSGGGTFLCGKIKRAVWEMGGKVYQEFICAY